MFNLKAVSSRASSLHQRTARYLSTRDGIMFDKILVCIHHFYGQYDNSGTCLEWPFFQ